MRRSLAGGSALTLVLVAAAAADGSCSLQAVQKLNAELIGVLKEAKQLGYEGRYARLAPVLAEAFDLDYMARAALGQHWERLSAAEQAQWVQTFTQLTNSTYAGRFEGYSGQQFETLGEEPVANETVLVHTRVIDPGNENVDIDYRLRPAPAGCKIIDVYLKGTVSEIALRRSEYAAVLKREGFAALLESVNQKIAALASGSGKP